MLLGHTLKHNKTRSIQIYLVFTDIHHVLDVHFLWAYCMSGTAPDVLTCVCASPLPAFFLAYPGCRFPRLLQMRELDSRVSLLNGSKTLRLCFHPLYRCTCRKGYVGDGSTCYGNIMERLRELNTEPGGKWQGRLTSFTSLLGT